MALLTGCLLTLGTSKTLEGKRLKAPRVTATGALEFKDEVRTVLVENKGNQGCFSRQVLDFKSTIQVRNKGDKPVTLTPKDVQLAVDGKSVSVTLVRFMYTKGRAPYLGKTLPPGLVGKLTVRARKILPKKRLKKIDRIQLDLKTSDLSLSAVYEGIRKLPVKSMRGGGGGTLGTK